MTDHRAKLQAAAVALRENAEKRSRMLMFEVHGHWGPYGHACGTLRDGVADAGADMAEAMAAMFPTPAAANAAGPDWAALNAEARATDPAPGQVRAMGQDGPEWRDPPPAASLIAAAPALLAAQTMGAQVNTPDFLDWVAARLVDFHGDHPNADFILSLKERARAGRAAIAQAEGR